MSAEVRALTGGLSQTSASTKDVEPQPWIAGKAVCPSTETRV